MDPKLLRILIDRARDVRDDAVKVSAAARRESEAAAATLRTLTDYRDESLSRGPVRSGEAVNTEQLRIAGQFDARLILAIRQQSGQHAHKQQTAEQRLADVREAQRRLKAFETIAERKAKRDLHKQGKREQRLLDEFATDLIARRRAQG